MGSKYHAYPEYKNFEGEWFGKIPIHWVSTQLKRVSSLKTGLTPPTDNQDNYVDELNGFPWIRPEDLNDNGNSVVASKYLSSSGWKLMRHVPAYSTLICCIGTIGKSGYTNYEISTNQQITAACFKYSPRYNYYLTQSAKEILEETSTGNVIKILNSERLGSIRFLSIPELEAEKIANFLDHETAKIDTLIEKQQQLIKLLKEKRQAVISHAVTKGLNPNAKMRDSGVDWLGEVPEHWEIWKLKHACSEIFLGLTSKVDYVESDGIPLVRALDIYGGVLSLDFAREISAAQHMQLTKYRRTQRNDVLLSKSGTIGTAAIVNTDDEFSIYESIFSLRAVTEILMPEYLLSFIQSSVAKAQYARDSVGMGVSHLNMPDIQEVKIPLPPIIEQKGLLEIIRDQQSKFDELIVKAELSVSLMQERRTALISAAVTGKIDVRNWQAPNG